jgi:hypothetical protein
MIVSVVVAIATMNGCANARPAIMSLWHQVPPVRWPSKGQVPAQEIPSSQPEAEPAMAANVALKNDNRDESDSSVANATTGPRPKSQLTRYGPRFIRPDPRANDPAGIADSTDVTDPNPGSPIDPPPLSSPLERLNAALTDDALQAEALPQRTRTTRDARSHVDTLIARAKRLFDIGQLDQARQTAQMAQDLGETAQLDYSPDEDRPVDLVRRIEGQMDAVQETAEPHIEKDRPEQFSGTDEQSPPGTITETAPQGNQAGKEAAGPTKIRRDWSKLFRREKKSAATEGDVAATITKGTIASSASRLREDAQPANPPTDHETRHAIVMANRSVTLGTPESVTSTSASFERDVAENLPVSEQESSRPEPHFGIGPDPDAGEMSDSTAAVIDEDPSTPVLESRETATAPPEFDAVDSETPFHEVESPSTERPGIATRDSTAAVRQSDWLLLYLGFGVCSLLAIGCYRRGAT